MFEIINEVSEEVNELDKINEFLNFVVKKEHLENCLFNIIIVDNDYIHKLNKEYRGIDRPTDVISFALEDTSDNIQIDMRILGDIYVCIPKMIEQANIYGHSIKRELSFLVVHGLLHLLGYDHMDVQDEKVMFGLQELILNEAGITR